MSTAQTFSKVLLITEATLSANGGGISQTLYNLFAAYPVDQLMAYTPEQHLKQHPPTPPYDQACITYRKELLPFVRNRLSFLLNPAISKINIQRNAWRGIPELEKIQTFDPHVLLICPNELHSLLMGWRIAMALNKPYIIFFMDDWMAEKVFRWIGGSLQTLVREVLAQAKAWLMISEPLKIILAERYQIKVPPTLVVHNPVDTPYKVPDFTPAVNKKFTIVYAGSIWPMHYDALLLTAKALKVLKEVYQTDAEILIYAKEEFWKWRKEELGAYPVRYGGYVPYHELQDKLHIGNLLLVTSSFLPEYASFSQSSVQTKLTDYMNSGVPMLSVGPTYSACHAFIKQWQCGIVFSQLDDKSLATFLIQQMNKSAELAVTAQRAFEVVKEHFSSLRIRQKLYDFIQQQLHNSKIYASY